jgi:hypothetical protein
MCAGSRGNVVATRWGLNGFNRPKAAHESVGLSRGSCRPLVRVARSLCRKIYFFGSTLGDENDHGGGQKSHRLFD